MDEMSSLTTDMDALARSLLLITTEYQNKKAQFETSRSTDLSGMMLFLICGGCSTAVNGGKYMILKKVNIADFKSYLR